MFFSIPHSVSTIRNIFLTLPQNQRIMKKLYILLIGIIAFTTVFASPALRFRITVSQPDGTEITLVRGGDEHVSYYATTDGYIVRREGNIYCYATGYDGGQWTVSARTAHDEQGRDVEESQWVAANAITELEVQAKSAQSRSLYETKEIGRSDIPKGEPKFPIILVEYSDVKFSITNPVDTFTRQYNEEGFSGNGAHGSVRDYFIAQSNGIYSPSFDICTVVTLSQPRAYYGAHSGSLNDARVNEMVSEAVTLAEAQGVDFSKYNGDDGTVPMLGILFAGYGEHSSWEEDAVWASFYLRGIVTSNTKIGSFLVTSELVPVLKKNAEDATKRDTVAQIEGIGTFCHEFSHFLNLPDFYNTYGSSTTVAMSWWSIMDYGQYWSNGTIPVGYTAYEKNFMGWLDIDTLVAEPQVVRINALGSDKENAYYIPNPNDATGNEYYILENRQPSTWYPSTLGSGMFITHVDYNKSAWASNTVNVNSSHKRMTFIAADNDTKIENKATPADYQGDLFPGLTGNTALRDTTVPNFQQYKGDKMNRYLTCITDTGGIVSFVYMAEGILPAPQSLTVEPNSDVSSLIARWSEVENATSYKLEAFGGDQSLYSQILTGTSVDMGGFPTEKNLTLQITSQADNYISAAPLVIKADNPVDIENINGGNAAVYDVYAVSGVKLLGNATLGSLEGKLPKGVYILKSDTETRKILVE